MILIEIKICTIKWLKIRQGLVKFEKIPYSTPFFVEILVRHSWVSTVEPPDMWYSVTREAKVPVEIGGRNATVAISLDEWSTRPRCDLWLFIFFDDNRKTSWIYYEYYICIWYYMIKTKTLRYVQYIVAYIYIYIFIYTYLALYPSQYYCSMQRIDGHGSTRFGYPGTHWRNRVVHKGCP